MDPDDRVPDIRGPAKLFLWPTLHLWEFQKPTVAAVHGYCVGGGTYFALLNDIVVAAEELKRVLCVTSQ